MTVLGLGTDIVEIARIAAVVTRSGEQLAQRILHATELQRYRHHAQPIHFLAKRFAAKEATAKAFGSGIRAGLAFNQIEVANDASGKPILILHQRAAEAAAALGAVSWHISLADERHYACATVIMQGV